MRVYEAIVKGLESIGVAAFGGAGENAANLLLALKHSTKIKPVVVRHEQAASFMACGYAIHSNRLGVCFATAGPGAFNLFSGLGVAMSDSYPVLAISGFARKVCKGKGALNETSGQSRTFDFQAMFAARPFESPTGEKILGTTNLNFQGRAAGSTDNCQATSFFFFNDTGAHFLKRLDAVDPVEPITPDSLIRRACECKVKILDRRPEFPREFPYYLDSNRFLSNVPGSTILFPVVNMTRQYINALTYLLTEPDGHRPAFRDDRNFYLPAGVGNWVRSGFLNKKIKLALGILGTMRTQIEAELLLQNPILMVQAMGLDSWIHASVAPTKLLPALDFRYVTPRYRWLEFFRWGNTEVRINPIGLPPYLECMCPPFYPSMSVAVQAVVDSKYRAGGTYGDEAYCRCIFQGDRGDKYLKEVPHYKDEVIARTKDICTYIYERHGRFPAHCDAIYAPGVWLQAHHLDLSYYDALFKTTRRKHTENISNAGTLSDCVPLRKDQNYAHISRNCNCNTGKIHICWRSFPRAHGTGARRRLSKGVARFAWTRRRRAYGCLLHGHFHDLVHRGPGNASVVFPNFFKKQRPQYLLASILDIWLSGVSSARLLGGVSYLRRRLERRV